MTAMVKRRGRTSLQKVLKGCALTESWKDTGGSEGLGVVYYSYFDNQWRKLYISDSANVRGGIRDRVLVAELPGGAVRFQGVVAGPAGQARIMTRTTLTPL